MTMLIAPDPLPWGEPILHPLADGGLRIRGSIRSTERLEHWAAAARIACFLASRDGDDRKARAAYLLAGYEI
jgi:hypothetical protein